MRSRFSSIGACLLALATLVAISAAPASAESRYRGEGRNAQSSGGEGGHSYRRNDRDGDRRGEYRRRVPRGFESGHSYRRDDRRDRDHRWRNRDHRDDHRWGYRYREHDYRKNFKWRRDRDDRRYRRDDDRRHHGHGGYRQRFDGPYSDAPPIVLEINPWNAD